MLCHLGMVVTLGNDNNIKFWRRIVQGNLAIGIILC